MLLMGFAVASWFSDRLLAGLVFASVVAVPLIIHRRLSLFSAISTSIEAVNKNPLAMFRWAATIAGIIAVGLALFFVGLAIAMPIKAND